MKFVRVAPLRSPSEAGQIRFDNRELNFVASLYNTTVIMENNPSPYAAPSSNVFAASSAVGEGITDGVIEQLRRTKGWVKLLGVLFIIGAVLMFIFGLVVMLGGGAIGFAEMSGAGVASGAMMVGMGIGNTIFGLLYLYPGIKLWKYGSSIDRLIQDRSNVTLEAALNEQRGFWKFVGVITLVVIVLYGLIIVGVGVFAGIAATSGS